MRSRAATTRRNFLLRATAGCCASFVSLQRAAPAIFGY
ncbi:twin-arginine translocation signal domain-containing protein [uncultured Campylobacter sp.]